MSRKPVIEDEKRKRFIRLFKDYYNEHKQVPPVDVLNSDQFPGYNSKWLRKEFCLKRTLLNRLKNDYYIIK